MMKIGARGVDLIKGFESFRSDAYIPVQGDVPTIGYGTTSGVRMGDKIDEKTADQYLKRDLVLFEKCINNAVGVILSQNQYDALCCLVYNIGCGAFQKSTILRLLNGGNYSLAADHILDWNKFRGKPLNGLTRRRIEERKLFLEP